jgi:hypothetical protein
LRGDDRKKPAYIDYNPDLPPAAFPTLERPRAARYGHDIHQRDNDEDRINKTSRRITRRSLDDICASVNTKGKREASPTAHVREIPLDQLDNYVASNGELNPIWVSNMARMAAAGKDADGDMDMEDTDLEGTVTGECRVSQTLIALTGLKRREIGRLFETSLRRKSRLRPFRSPTISGAVSIQKFSEFVSLLTLLFSLF